MTLNPFDWTAGPFLTLYACLALAVFAMVYWLRESMGGRAKKGVKLNVLEWAYLAGGPGRLCDVALLCLAANDGAVVMPQSHKITVSDPAPLAALAGAHWPLPTGREITRAEFLKATGSGIEQVRRRLQSCGYCPTDEEVTTFRLSALLPVGLLLAFGAVKAAVGASRNHPVGILVVFMLATAGVALYMLRSPTRTRAAADALLAQRKTSARAVRAPLDHELTLAVALGGALVLSGTAYAAIYDASRASGRDGGGGGGDGCGGGGGGGCGGCS